MFTEKLGDVLVRRKIASFRSVRTLFLRHDLKVNGNKVLMRNVVIRTGIDVVTLDGIPLEIPPDIYIMMNKPKGFECSHIKNLYNTVFELLPKEFLHPEYLGILHTVGRLDVDTEGLLLFTTNGNLSYKLALPSFCVKKTYFVRLKKSVSSDEKSFYSSSCLKGIYLEKERNAPASNTLPSNITWLSNTELNLTLMEGKYHEVKRIFKTLGNEVIYLKRIFMAGLSLDSALKPGEFRHLTEEEIVTLHK